MQRAWPWLFTPVPCFYNSEHHLYRYTLHDCGEQYSQHSTLRFLLKEVKKVKKRPACENLKANNKIKAFNTTKEKFLQLLPPSTPKSPLLRMPVPQPVTLFGDSYCQLPPWSSCVPPWVWGAVSAAHWTCNHNWGEQCALKSFTQSMPMSVLFVNTSRSSIK